MTIVDITTGELRPAYSDVKRSVEAARESGARFFEQIVWQIENRAWEVLDYESWDEMREAEYGDMGVVVPRADRPEIVARLRRTGMTQQKIAEEVGVHEATVSRDLANARSGGHALTGATAEAKVNTQMGNENGNHRPARAAGTGVGEGLNLNSENEQAAHTITNSRGQERPATYTKPEPTKPRRTPLPDTAWRVAYDLRKKSESLTRVIEDDRFKSNKEQIAGTIRNELLLVQKAVAAALQELPEEN